MTDTPEIVKGAPLTIRRVRNDQLKNDTHDLVRTAIADPGEWYSIPSPNRTNPSSVGTLALTQIAKAVAKYSTKDGRIWIRFNE